MSLSDVLIWIANGFLVVLFFLVDHLPTILLLGGGTALVYLVPAVMRLWAVGAGILSIAASLFAPAPAPVMLVVLALASAAAVYLEQYNRPARFWVVIGSLSGYSLLGLAYTAWQVYSTNNPQADPATAQGLNYFSTIAGIAMYVLPLAAIVMLVQSVLAHPPSGSPQQILTQVRTRGKER